MGINNVVGPTYERVVVLPIDEDSKAYSDPQKPIDNLELRTEGLTEIELKASPNPVTFSNSTVSYVLPEGTTTGELIITAIEGRVVHRQNLRNQSDKLLIDISMYENGVYFYTLLADGKHLKSVKFIIAR